MTDFLWKLKILNIFNNKIFYLIFIRIYNIIFNIYQLVFCVRLFAFVFSMYFNIEIEILMHYDPLLSLSTHLYNFVNTTSAIIFIPANMFVIYINYIILSCINGKILTLLYDLTIINGKQFSEINGSNRFKWFWKQFQVLSTLWILWSKRKNTSTLRFSSSRMNIFPKLPSTVRIKLLWGNCSLSLVFQSFLRLCGMIYR